MTPSRLPVSNTVSGSDQATWRRGKESNLPRPDKRADSGFEDRGDHQAPITLREDENGRKGNEKRRYSELGLDLLKDGLVLREFSRL